jgi:hypothetical protein
MSSLTPTFRDALQMTRRLGVRYLWIDSLCISEDDNDDWIAESAVMGKIHKYSLCNIAATAAAMNQNGLFQERDARLITPYRTRIDFGRYKENYTFFANNFYRDLVWETDLNRRTLHYASQMFWECRALQACETYPAGLPFELNQYEDHKGSILLVSLKNWQQDIPSKWSWNELVETYATFQLIKSEDRLVAIAGIAEELQRFLQDDYLAGIWKKDLPQSLLWSLSNSHDGVTKSKTNRCKRYS